MIRCVPVAICSWDYHLQSPGHFAELRSGFSSAPGMFVNGRRMEIVREGFFTHVWSLREGGREIGRAEKTSTLKSEITGFGPGGSFQIWSDAMHVSIVGRAALIIKRDHMFTRRATIHGDFKDFTTAAFAFWLIALTWRRAAQSD